MQTFSPRLAKTDAASTARKIFALIANELSLVEAEFEQQAASNIQVINYLGDYLRASGGKRVRPSLLILSNYAVDGDASAENVIRLAVVMEMLHTATLVHDDIIDNADTRRSRKTINARFGNHSAVLMGDWLYMSAFETSLKERSLEILDILTTLTRKMTEGELIQLTTLGKISLSEAEYFDILQRKTAFLFSACCEIGAILAGASKEQQIALRDYGMKLGIAFQLADDWLDFTASEKVLGKASGADLLEGKVTYPLLLLLKKKPEYYQILENIVVDGSYSSYSRERLYDEMQTHGVLEATRQKAFDYAAEAQKKLEILGDSKYRLALDEISTFIIDRNK